MGRFTVIPQDTFQGLQLDAGVLLRRFNPAAPAVLDEDIICATTGGINPVCTPTYSDLGSDVDNCPVDMKELKHLDSWSCTMAFTSIGTSKESIRLALGAADINAETGAIVPRKDLKQTDFSDVWWVGDRADGGCVAIQLKNALSTGGFSLQTTKSGKGQVSVTLTGHVSLNAQSVMPMVIYSLDPDEVTAYTVAQRLVHVVSTFTGNSIEAGAEFTATLTADTGYDIANVVVLMGGVDLTEDAYDDTTGVVTISGATGDIEIVATAVAEG